jgi:PhzF family phenazine biosynthesis protein
MRFDILHIMNVTVYLLNAFISKDGGGNPAGVVLNAENLTNDQKKQIAAEVGFPETAFVESSKKADFKVTFFTPTEEVDICAHATIATYTLLLQKSFVEAKSYMQEIKAGVLPVEIIEDGTIFMDQTKPTFFEELSIERLADILQIDGDLIKKTSLIPQVVSTGSREILVPILTREALFSLQPDTEKMIKFNKETKTNGYKVFTFETISPDATAHSRDFAPHVGIPEESATGITTGPLACYLYKYGKLTNVEIKDLTFEQGYSMNKPSLLNVSLTAKNSKIIRVQIGGKAILIGKKEISALN